MAIERWNDEKLDGLADIVSDLGIKVQNLTDTVEGLTLKIDQTTDTVQGLALKIDQTTALANSNARVVQALANAMAEAAEERRAAAEERRAAAEERREIIQLIKQQQSEIRGLQTENQRMWEILFSQRNQNDNPDAEAV